MSFTPSLGTLEPEVVALILEFVDDVSPATTKAVACVNRYLNRITRLISHRHKQIEVKGARDEEFKTTLKSWLDDEVLLNIRTLSVKGSFGSPTALDLAEFLDEDDEGEEDDDANNHQSAVVLEQLWQPLVTLLQKIGRLRQFDWSVNLPLPVAVVDALHNHQKSSQLRIFKFVRTSASSQAPEPVEILLANSPALTHIRQTNLGHHVDASPDLREVAFRSIVASAPNLKYAGILRRPFGQPAMRLSQSNRDRIHAAFYKHTSPNSSIEQLMLDGIDISKGTLDDWSSIVDLSTLENVKFTSGHPTLDWFQCAHDMLPGLKHLSLNFRLLKEQPDNRKKSELKLAIQNYLTTCSPLTTLSLWSWMKIVTIPEILQHHGAGLKELQLRERETVWGGIRNTLTIEELRSIREACPNLKSFTFDLNRTDKKLRWASDDQKMFYEELAKFEQLEAVQIYFDVGTAWLDAELSIRAHFLAGTSSIFADEESGSEDEYSDHEDEYYDREDGDEEEDGLDDVTRSPPSGRAPPIIRPVKPSRDAAWEAYIKQIWSTLFGHKTWGTRLLEVKVGEWEAQRPFYIQRSSQVEVGLMRYFVVRAHERDDTNEAMVKTYKKTA